MSSTKDNKIIRVQSVKFKLNILDPSSGGIGSKLKKAIHELMKAITLKE